MDSFDVMKNYMQKEMGKSVTTNRQAIEARKLINKVRTAKGKDLVEQAHNAGVSYEDFMKAQRII